MKESTHVQPDPRLNLFDQPLEVAFDFLRSLRGVYPIFGERRKGQPVVSHDDVVSEAILKIRQLLFSGTIKLGSNGLIDEPLLRTVYVQVRNTRLTQQNRRARRDKKVASSRSEFSTGAMQSSEFTYDLPTREQLLAVKRRLADSSDFAHPNWFRIFIVYALVDDRTATRTYRREWTSGELEAIEPGQYDPPGSETPSKLALFQARMRALRDLLKGLYEDGPA